MREITENVKNFRHQMRVHYFFLELVDDVNRNMEL